MGKKEKRPTKKQKATDLSTLRFVCTRFGDCSEIDAFIQTTGKWETVATIYPVAGIDAEDIAEFFVHAVSDCRREP